jgi:hypothetical protein
MTITLQALSLAEKAELVQVRSTPMLEGPTEHISKCKMDVKSTWIPTRASNGSCFMVTWIIFQNHLLEVQTARHGTPNAHNC